MSGRSNNAGIYNFENLNAQNLYIKGRPFIDYINEIVFEDQLDDQEIAEIQAFLARLDISNLTGNLVLDDNNRNAVLKTAIDGILSKLTYLDTTGLSSSWVITDSNRNATLKTAIDTQAGTISGIQSNVSALQTKTQYISSSSNTITIAADTINLNGGVYTNNATFPSLTVSSSLTWAQLGALIATTNIPSWVISQILTSGIPNFVYSDLWAQKSNIVGVKDGSVETTKTAKISNYSLYNTDLNLANLFPVENTFIASGSSSKTILNGSIKQQVFNGDIVIRNNNLTNMNLVDWTLTEADDAVNALYIKGNNMGLHMGAGTQGSSLDFINSVGGDIIFKTGGTNGQKSSTQTSLRIKYANNFLEQIQMGFIDTNVWNPSSIGAKLFVSQLYNQGAGIVVGSPDVYPATNHKFSYYNSTHTSTGALILQDNYSGSTNKAIYTAESGQKLFYSGQQVYPPLPQNVGGVGITYLIQNPSSVSAPATLTMSETYVSQPSQTVTLSSYNNNTNYLLTTVRGAIPNASNPIISGVLQHDQWVAYTANQTGQIWDVVNFRATSTQNGTYDHPTRGTVIYSNVLRFVYPKQNNSEVNNTAVAYTAYIPVCNNSATLTLHTVTIPWVAYSASGNYFARLEIVNAAGSVIHQFTDVAYSPSVAQTLDFTSGSLQTFNITNTTAFRFKLTNLGTTNPLMIQASNSGAQGNNGLMYVIRGDANQVYSTLLYDGVNNKTTLTNNSTANYILTLPISTMDITQLYEPNIEIQTRFIQPSGTTTNHSVALLYNDNYLSHLDSTFSTTTATPTIQQVLTSGNNAGNLNILSLGTIEPSAITNWNVKEITAGTNISRTISSGTYTISNSAPVQNAQAGTNIGVSIASNTATISNTAPVQDAAAGSGISISKANNVATISNTAVVQDTQAGTGISISKANGVATISNTGVTELFGGNGITVSTSTGSITISQSIFQSTGSINDQQILDVSLFPNNRQSDYGKRWREATGLAQLAYNDCYISITGQVIVICTVNTNGTGTTLTVSNDYGQSYNTVLMTSPSYVWNGVCGSATGHLIYALSSNPKKIVRSNNFGYDFTALADPLNLDWSNAIPSFISCSSDGTFVMISDQRSGSNGKVYTTADGATNWNSYNITSNPAMAGDSCMSSNGLIRYIIMIEVSGHLTQAGIYRTNNYGSTWEKRQSKANTADNNFRRIDCDATGRVVVASRDVGSLTSIISRDYGQTWVSIGVNLLSCCITPNSSIVFGGGVSGKIWISTDSGWNFKELDNPVGSAQHLELATNGDATLVVATSASTTVRPYFYLENINFKDLAISHFFSYSSNLLTTSGGSFTAFPNLDLKNNNYEITFEYDKVYYNRAIFMGFNSSINVPYQMNMLYTTTSVTNAQTALNYIDWNTNASGSGQVYQASDSSGCQIFYSPNNGSFFYCASVHRYRLYAPSDKVLIMERINPIAHYRTYNSSIIDGKGQSNTLGSGVGIDYTTIRGRVETLSVKIYLSGNSSTTWAPSNFILYPDITTNVIGTATVKISDITKCPKNQIT